MLTRTITGVLFVAAIVASVYYGAYSTGFLFIVIVLLGIDEFYGMVKKNKTIHPQRIWGDFTGLVLISSAILYLQGKIDLKYLLVAFILFFFTFIIELYRKKEHSFINIAYTLLGTIYVTLPFVLLYNLGYYNTIGAEKTFDFQLILGFFILLWANDTGAYLAGKFLGKHKLFERISPKKTWEGSIGGGLLTIGLSILIANYFDIIDLKHWIAISIIIVVFGGLGDLVESMFKRSLGIKDSGNILPGHGGILDRFDGLLIAAPFVYSYLYLIR